MDSTTLLVMQMVVKSKYITLFLLSYCEPYAAPLPLSHHFLLLLQVPQASVQAQEAMSKGSTALDSVPVVVARGFDKNRKACETWKKKGIRVDRCSKKYSNTFPSPLTRAFEKSNMHPSAILISVLSLAALAAVTTAQFTLFPASTSAVTEVTRADQAAFTSTGLSDAPYKLVLYYSAQCPHCQAFAPQYEVTAKTFASSCPDLDFQVRFLRYFVCLVSPSSPALLFRSTFFVFFLRRN